MTQVYNKCIGAIVYYLSKIAIKFDFKLKLDYERLRNQIINCDTLAISKILIDGIIIMEDKRYYEHYGFDVHAILRAFKSNLKKKRFQGASTIEQQLVRTLTNRREISYKRKLLEVVFATLISREFNKSVLLEIYLNVYPFKNLKGVFELCRVEKHDFQNLSLNDVSEIVARIKYPTVNNYNYIRYLKRVRTVQIKLQ